MDLARAEKAVHGRAALSFDAAVRAEIEGRFRAFESGGLLVLLTSARGLGFMNVVTVMDELSIHHLPGVLHVYRSAGIGPPTVVTVTSTPAVREQLATLGFAPSGTRPIAVFPLRPEAPTAVHGVDHGSLRVTRVRTTTERACFVEVLLNGYAASAEVARLIRAEHADPDVLGFIAWLDDRPVAAAGMSLHGQVAVLGGASTCLTDRGRGSQTALLHHRLGEAAGRGATVATATAAPGSPSLRNLARVGGRITPREAWSFQERAPSPG